MPPGQGTQKERTLVKLPDHGGLGPAIGPTDIAQYRACPRRFEFGMRRHGPAGEPTEALSSNTAYGSALHDVVAFLEANDASDDEAIQHGFDRWAAWLEPGDLQRMRDDLAVYHDREPLGVRLIAVEREVMTPLFEFEGQTVYLRGKLDRLYQRLDNPAVFVHVDYKTSRWAKTEAEVHSDTQLWAYNLLIHEEWPECETLVQLYDQLSHGAIPTRKTDAQRAEIKEWLIRQVTAILRDTELRPTHNEFCAWCPLMESCPVVGELSDFALARIAALAPAEKVGRKTVVRLDPDRFEVYAEQLEQVAQARKVLDRFDESVRAVIKDMPDERRAQLGYEVFHRSADAWPREALEAVHGVLGDDFYEVASISKTRLTERLGKDDERVDVVLGMAERTKGAAVVKKIAA